MRRRRASDGGASSTAMPSTRSSADRPSSTALIARIKGNGIGDGDEEWALVKTIQLWAAMLGLPQLQSPELSFGMGSH